MFLCTDLLDFCLQLGLLALIVLTLALQAFTLKLHLVHLGIGILYSIADYMC